MKLFLLQQQSNDLMTFIYIDLYFLFYTQKLNYVKLKIMEIKKLSMIEENYLIQLDI